MLPEEADTEWVGGEGGEGGGEVGVLPQATELAGRGWQARGCGQGSLRGFIISLRAFIIRLRGFERFQHVGLKTNA